MGAPLKDGLAVTPEVLQRFVVRVAPSPPPVVSESPPPRTALVVGRSPRAEAVAEQLRASGARVRTADDAASALAALTEGGTDLLGFVLETAEERRAFALPEEEWASRREAALAGPARVIHAAFAAGGRKPSCIFAMTALGGALGFDNVLQGAPEGAALAALLSSVQHTQAGLQVRVLDLPPSISPRHAAEVLLQELGSADHVREVGFIRGHHMGLVLAPREASGWAGGTSHLPSAWLVAHAGDATSAEACVRLASLYGPALELIGPKAPDADLLHRIEQAGSRVAWHEADLADRGSLASALDTIRSGGPLAGLVHGAGSASQLDGLVHLLALTAEDPLTHAVAFTSISGRFGSQSAAGAVDAAACEAIARFIGTLRAVRPKLRAAALAFPDPSRTSALEAGNHFVRELLSGLPEAHVLFSPVPCELDRSSRLADMATIERWRQLDRRASASPMLDTLIRYGSDTSLSAERVIDAAEPFLDHHRIGPTPILPAVIGLEMMAELVGLTGGRFSLGEVEIAQTLKVRPGTSTPVRVTLEGDALRVTAGARRPDGVILEPERVHLTARRLAPAPLPTRDIPPWEGQPSPFPYPRQIDRTRGSRLMYHGPVFRCLEGVLPREGGGLARLVVPPVKALVRGSEPDAWVLPAAFLDGCLQAAGLLGRILFSISALPVVFGRIDVAPRAVHATGERVIVDVRIERLSSSEIEADILAVGADGPLIHVSGYRARAMRGL